MVYLTTYHSFQLIGVPEKTYVREVTFVVPSTTLQGTPPQILMASVNLSLSNIVKVKERISYTPSQDGMTTLFQQQALINAAGKFKLDGRWRSIGERIEGWSLDRCVLFVPFALLRYAY